MLLAAAMICFASSAAASTIELSTAVEALWSTPTTQTAEEKLNAMWVKIEANETSHGFMSPMQTAKRVGNTTYLGLMGSTTFGDERPVGHEKISHGIAGHAKAHFEWEKHAKGNPVYSGLFKQADHCIIRIANAAKPSRGLFSTTSYNPNMAVKCFADGVTPSGNLQTIWTIDGFDVLPEDSAGKPAMKDSCSFFDVPLSNHCGRRDNISMPLKTLFIGNFAKVDPNPLMLGVSQMATRMQEGGIIAPVDVNFPYALVFEPDRQLKHVPCDFGNVTSQLQNLAGEGWVGKAIYSVFAVHDPWLARPEGKPDLKLIGRLVLDSPFITSNYGDTRLFFRHTFNREELHVLEKTVNGTERAAAWTAYNDQWYKAEGSVWYRGELPPSVAPAP